MSKTDEIEQLDEQIEQALSVLNPRRQKFAMFLAEGNETQSGAAKKAGYSENRAEVQGSQLLANSKVKSAVQLLRKKNQLEHGIASSEKRQRLLEIADTAKQPGDNYQPSAAVRALHELNLMDGSHAALKVKHQHLKVNVNIGYDVQLPEREEKVIEHGNDEDA